MDLHSVGFVTKTKAKAAFHSVLHLLVGSRSAGDVVAPKRILLMSTGHMGDTVISTSLLPVLKVAYPGVEIGFVTPSWARIVLRHHPDVKYIHTVDHKIMNRQLQGRAKNRRYAETRKQALKEMAAVKYDVSICLHPWRPDLLRLAWQAKIPVRAAFSSSLLAPLATHLAEYPEHDPLITHGEAQARLLRSIGISEEDLSVRKASLPPSSLAAIREVTGVLSLPSLQNSNYAVVHMGSGVREKELPNSFWREMAHLLSSQSILLFTGKGTAEAANISEVTKGVKNCIDACDKLSWDGVVAAIRFANIVYSVDTMAGHVAAAVSTPCVAMFGGNNGVGRWRPEGENCVVWSKAMPCAPCRRQHGCSDMKCMQGFLPTEILSLPAARQTSSLVTVVANVQP